MKNVNYMFLILCLSLCTTFNAKAQDATNDVTISSLEQKQDANGPYYSLELDGTILPSDVGGAVGYKLFDSLVEVEAYVKATVIRLISDENIHMPYGARLRVKFGKNSRWFAEYQRQEVENFGNTYGLYEVPNAVFVGRFNGDKSSLFALGLGESTHHAWSDEIHAPEKGTFIGFRYSKRFNFRK